MRTVIKSQLSKGHLIGKKYQAKDVGNDRNYRTAIRQLAEVREEIEERTVSTREGLNLSNDGNQQRYNVLELDGVYEEKERWSDQPPEERERYDRLHEELRSFYAYHSILEMVTEDYNSTRSQSQA